MEMKCTVYDLEVMGSNPIRLELGCAVLPSKSYLNQKYIRPTRYVSE